MIVDWRFTAAARSQRPRSVTQKCVALSFYLQAPDVAIESLHAQPGEHLSTPRRASSASV